MTLPEPQRAEIATTLPITYYHLNAGQLNSPLILALHGYTDSARAFLRRAFHSQIPTYEILAPNAPFMVPVKKDAGYKEAYSWYFIDPATETMIVPPSVSIGILTQLLCRLGLQDRDLVILGFSQGGFFAPYFTRAHRSVRQAIGIGCAFREQAWQGLEDVPVDAIHGSEDEIVSHDRSRRSHERLKEMGFEGEFFSVPGLGHTLNDEARGKLNNLLQLALAP